MDEWTHARVGEIRDRMSDDDEGTLWVLFLDDPRGEPLTGIAVDALAAEGAGYDDDALEGLAALLDEARPAAVLLAVSRASGTPHPADVRLLESLRARLIGPTDVLDLIVVGRHTACSAVVAA